MRHMGNSGKLAVVSAVASLGLLVLAAVLLEELLLYLFLCAVLCCYLACVVQLFGRHRYLVLTAGAVGTSLSIGFTIAFLRMWGLAFTQETDSVGTAVSSQDPDIYFYLASVAGCSTLLLLFAGAVWPSRRPRTTTRRPAQRKPQRPAPRTVPRKAAPRKPAAQRAPAKRR